MELVEAHSGNLRHSKSSRRALFKENLSPKSKLFMRAGRGMLDLGCNPSRKKPHLSHKKVLQLNKDIKNKTSSSRKCNLGVVHGRSTSVSNALLQEIDNDEIATSKTDQTCWFVQDNVEFCRQSVGDISHVNESFNIQDNVINRLALGAEQVFVAPLSKNRFLETKQSHLGASNQVQDNVAYSKSRLGKGFGRGLQFILKKSRSNSHHEERLLSDEQERPETGHQFIVEQPDTTDEHWWHGSICQQKCKVSVQDNIVSKQLGWKPRNLSQDKEQNSLSNWIEPDDSSLDQSNAVPVNNSSCDGQEERNAAKSPEEVCKTPEQWLVEPLQRLAHDLTTDQSVGSGNISYSMETNGLPPGAPDFSRSHDQVDKPNSDSTSVPHPLQGQGCNSISRELERNHTPELQHPSFRVSSNDPDYGSSDILVHQRQTMCKTIPSQHHQTIRNLSLTHVAPKFPKREDGRPILKSRLPFGAPVDEASRRLEPLSNNHDDLIDMESQHLLRSDSTRSTSQSTDFPIGHRNFNLSLTTSVSSPKTGFASSTNLGHPNQGSLSSLELYPSENTDHRKLDQLDVADLNRLSEMGEFIYSRSQEGLYAHSARVDMHKESVSRVESGVVAGQQRIEFHDQTENEMNFETQDIDPKSHKELSENQTNCNMDGVWIKTGDHQVRVTSSLDRTNKIQPGHQSWRESQNCKEVLEEVWGAAFNHSSVPSVTDYSANLLSMTSLSLDEDDNRTVNSFREAVNEPASHFLLTNGTQTENPQTPKPPQTEMLRSSTASTVRTAQCRSQISLATTSRKHPTNSLSSICNPTFATRLSKLKLSHTEAEDTALTMGDLYVDSAPQRVNEKHVTNTKETLRHSGSRTKKFSAAGSHLSSKQQKSTAVNPGNRLGRRSFRRQDGNTIGVNQRTKTIQPQQLDRCPKPVKSAGFPRKSHASSLKSTSCQDPSKPTLSSSSSPRRTTSILWAFKILDILHSAPPDRHEELVTKVYWFRRWHRRVRLIKLQRDERMELWRRANDHHRLCLLQRCLSAWQQALAGDKRAADNLRQNHLLQKGLNGLKWAAMQGRLEMEAAVERSENKMLQQHFSIWSDLCQVQTERTQLLEKLTRRRSIAAAFWMWKDQYSMIQKDGIARLHFKVSLLSRGFQCWKLFTRQSKIKVFFEEMSRVYYEERSVAKTWCTVRAVYAQMQKASKHYRRKLLSVVLHSWLRGSQLGKAERRHHHGQATELRRHGLLRVHFKQWKEESIVAQSKQRLNAVRMRFVWELWTLRLQRKQLYRRIMDARARKVAKKHIFHKWRQVARRQKETSEQAAGILTRMYLNIVLTAWRSQVVQEQDLRRNQSFLVTSISLRVKQQTLDVWMSRLKAERTKQAAHRTWSLRCVCKAVNRWRQMVHHQVIERKLQEFGPVHDRFVKKAAFGKWILQFRLALRDHQRVFSAQQMLLRNQLLRLLLSWQLVVKETKTITPLLKRKNLKQLACVFDAWREITVRKKACRHHQDLLLTQCLSASFIRWRGQTVVKKKLEDVQKTFLASKLSHVFCGWRRVAKRQANLTALKQQQRDRSLRQTFERWCQATEEQVLCKEVEKGEKVRRILLLGACLQKWIKNVQRQKDNDNKLQDFHRRECSFQKLRRSYKIWKCQLHIQNTGRDLQCRREASLVRRTFMAWYNETRSSYDRMTERFHMVCSMGFSDDISSLKSASSVVSLDRLPPSSSVSSTQGIIPQLSTTDSGYCGNGNMLQVPASLDAAQGDQEGLPSMWSPRSGLKMYQHASMDDHRLKKTRKVLSPRQRFEVFTEDKEHKSAEPSSHQRNPRWKGTREDIELWGHLKPASLIFDGPIKVQDAPRSSVSSHYLPSLRRLESLDQSFRENSESEEKHHTQSFEAADDENLLSFVTISSSPKNIHGMPHSESPPQSSEEELEANSNNEEVLRCSISKMQNFESCPHSPNGWGVTSASPIDALPFKDRTKFFVHQCLLGSKPSLKALSPRSSKSSPFSSPRSHNTSKRDTPLGWQDVQDSMCREPSPEPKSSLTPSSRPQLKRLSPEELPDDFHQCSSPSSLWSSYGRVESAHSDSFCKHLFEHGHDLNQSVALSVFSDDVLPLTPLVDRRAYLRSVILHWRLWPASAAFNQWLNFTRRCHNLRKLESQAKSLMRNLRLSNALTSWRKWCYAERRARKHWEMKTKEVHLLAWLHQSQESKRLVGQEKIATDKARHERLRVLFRIWQTKHKQRSTLRIIVHSWRSYIRRTVDLVNRTGDLQHKMQECCMKICFLAWKQSTWQSLQVKAHYNLVITHRIIISWARWTGEKVARQCELDVFQTRRQKRMVLHVWRAQLFKLQTAREFYCSAVVLHLKGILSSWREYASMKRQRDEAVVWLIQERENRMVHVAWTVWKREGQIRQEMQQVYLTNLAKTVIQAWHHQSAQKRNLGLVSAAAKCRWDERLKVHALQVWQQALRSHRLTQQMLVSVRCKRLTLAFTEWKRHIQRFHSQKFRHRSLLKGAFRKWQHRIVKQKSTRLVVQRIVHLWQKQTQRSKELDQSVASYIAQKDTMIRRSSLDAWKLAWQQQMAAIEHCNTMSLSRCIRSWHAQSAKRKKLQALLQMYQKNHHREMLVSSLNKWKQKQLHFKELQKRLTLFSQKRATDILARVVRAWHRVTMELLAMQRYKRAVQTKAWTRWQKSLIYNRKAVEMADTRWTQTRVAVFRAVLHFSQVRKSQRESLHLVTAQRSTKTLQDTFVFWRIGSQKALQAKAQAHFVLLSKVLRGWVSGVRRQFSLNVTSEMTQTVCNKLRLQSAFRVWEHRVKHCLLLKELLKEALERQDQVMLHRTFNDWWRTTTKKGAIKHLESTLLKWGWSVWSRKARERVLERQFEEDTSELADNHYNRHISRIMLQLWSAEARVCRMKRKRNRRLAEKYLTIWRKRTKMAAMARALDAYWRIQRTWRAWRRHLLQSSTSKTVQHLNEQQLKQQTFKMWCEQAKANSLRKDLLNRRLHAAFTEWRKKALTADKSERSSISDQSDCASSSGASELAAIWMSGQVYGNGGSAQH